MLHEFCTNTVSSPLGMQLYFEHKILELINCNLTSEVINQLVYRLPCRKVTVAHVNSNDLHQLC